MANGHAPEIPSRDQPPLAAPGFDNALAWLNVTRRRLGRFFADYDLLLSPITALVSQPHGLYGLNLPGVSAEAYMRLSDEPVQFCFPYNICGTPAISLPLAMHSNGLPIGVQLGANPAREDLLLTVARALEEARPWSCRLPPLHVSQA